MTIKEKFKKYAELKIQEKLLKDELESLKPDIKNHINDSGFDKLESDFGIFSLKLVPVWKFSDKVKSALEEVEKLKEQEKADGTAQADMRSDLVFKAK